MSDAPVSPSAASAAAQERSRRWWLGGGVALAAGLAGGSVAWWQHRAASGNDEAVRAFWALQLQTPDGAPLALQSLQGRPLLVNFWATWCPPCVRELPMLAQFAQQQGERGVQVLGIAVDQAPAVQKYLARQPLPFAVAMAGSGGIGLTRSLGNLTGGLPFSLLLNQGGAVRQRKIGELSAEDLALWARSA